MSWILVCGAAVCGWAMLRTMGGERERRILEQRLGAPSEPTLPKPSPRDSVPIAQGIQRKQARPGSARRPPRQAA